jgi:prepilin-type N-terminal cleavage/methylation domain-containing protein
VKWSNGTENSGKDELLGRGQELTNSKAKIGIPHKRQLDCFQEGFGLIEVLIAISLLGIIGVAFLSGLSTSIKTNFTAEKNTTAISVARSQLENVKTQDYIVAAFNGEVTYSMVTSTPGYFIGSINRAGTEVASVIGIPWDTQDGVGHNQAVSTDAGIQRIRLVVRQGGSWATGSTACTIDTYKVKP